MSRSGVVVTFETGGHLHKLCRIFFGRDGSYYVTAPYHPARKALLMKATVVFSKPEQLIPDGEAVDVASLDDDDLALKLAHHPSGYVQFSGPGVVSGKDANGNIKGVGVDSWPLRDPASGPAFGLAMVGVESYLEAAVDEPDLMIFKENDLAVFPMADTLVLEGFYLPPDRRRFITRDREDHLVTRIVHPDQAVLDLRVILAPIECELPGFIGLTLYSVATEMEPFPRFMLSGPTGNLRHDPSGELVGDGIFAVYPRPWDGRRSLNLRHG
jgi:hypothetical protein